MSQLSDKSRFKHKVKKWSIQICEWLLFVSVIWPESFAYRLESPDAVFLNRRYNTSKVVALGNKDYFPSVVSNVSVPKVIDNTDTRHPGNKIFRYYCQSSSSQAKHFRQNAVQIPSHVEISDLLLTNPISIEGMSCQNTKDKLFFRVSIKARKISSPPIINNKISEACRAITIKDTYHINFEGDQFWNCGVVDCSIDDQKSYCLDLRFPTITGFRLKDDYRLILRCKAQEKIVNQTKRINVNILETKARNIPNVINGGSNNMLDVDVGLFRKTYGSETNFDTKIESGGTVVLGEEILLRVLVNGNDGWRHSKIGQVTVHYVEKKQRENIVNSLWILNKDGCLNSDVHEICPREQYMSSSLESHLIFQAFMFEGMKETDDIFLTVKTMACLEAIDCILDCPAGHIRRTRTIHDHNNTIEWQDDILLRIILPKYGLRISQNYYLPILLSIVTLCILLIVLSWTIKVLFR